MWTRKTFDQADTELELTRFGKFDAEPDAAYVHAGDLHIPGDWTGGDLYRACGRDPESDRLRELTMFVVDGDLTVDGTLAPDSGIYETIGLAVTGKLRAGVVAVGATMLFVYGGAEVTHLIKFDTTDGTISIAGRTECPLVIYDEGDLNVASTGHILCRRYESLEGVSEPRDEEIPDWGRPFITLSRAEVPDALVEGLYDEDGWVDAGLALTLAREGKPLLRPGYGRR